MKKHFYLAWGVIFLMVVVLTLAHLSSRNSTTYIRSTPTASVPKASSTPIALTPAPVTKPAPAKPAATAPAASAFTATSYLVGNAETGQIYISKNTSEVSGIASISKLFTVLVANANMDPNQVITITQPMLDVYENSYGFGLGEKFTLSDLVYPILIESNNNLAEGIAQTYGYAAFIQKMNAFATSIGLTKTHFADASGLSNGNISNANDLFTFARYLYASQRNLLALTTTYSWTFASTTDHGAHLIQSTDPFIGDPHLVGGKTGRTDAAGETMMTIFDYQLNGKTYPIVVVVLHAALGERQNDSSRLLVQAIALINKQNP